MNLTSSLVDEIIATTGLRNIESAHFAGRHGDFFIYLEMQTHLSRALMRIRVLGLDEVTRTALEATLAANISRINYSVLYEGNEILIIVPSNSDWVKRIRVIMDLITDFLAAKGVRADSQAEKLAIEHIPESIPHIEYENTKTLLGWGLLGSFLGAVPGVIGWFISSIASNDGFMVQTPEVHNYLSARFLLSIIITCGSYWGFLLLSGASRKISALLSAPITLLMIYIVNRFSYAFLFFTAISNLTVDRAFLKTYEYLNSYDLVQYYLGTLFLGYLLSGLTYLFLYKTREKFWKKQQR